jgi:hypothetical protein
VVDRLGFFADYFQVKERLQKLHHTAHIVKIQLGNQGMGKPLVDQYEQLKQIAIDMIANTKEIIVDSIYDRRLKEKKSNILHDYVYIGGFSFVDRMMTVVLSKAFWELRFFSNSNSDMLGFCVIFRPNKPSSPKSSLQLFLIRPSNV